MKFAPVIDRKFRGEMVSLHFIQSQHGHFGLAWNKKGTRAEVVFLDSVFTKEDAVYSLEGEVSATALLRKFPEAKVIQYEYGFGGGAWFAYSSVDESNKTRNQIGESRVRR